MLTTTTPACSHATSRAHGATPPPVTALRVALDDAHARLDAALADLRTLVSHERLGSDDASTLAAEYVERYLRRVAALEERGALACTPDEWQRFTATAARRTTARRRAAARRECVRNEVAAPMPRRGAGTHPGPVPHRAAQRRSRRRDPRDPR